MVKYQQERHCTYSLVVVKLKDGSKQVEIWNTTDVIEKVQYLYEIEGKFKEEQEQLIEYICPIQDLDEEKSDNLVIYEFQLNNFDNNGRQTTEPSLPDLSAKPFDELAAADGQNINDKTAVGAGPGKSPSNN